MIPSTQNLANRFKNSCADSFGLETRNSTRNQNTYLVDFSGRATASIFFATSTALLHVT
jgi:hypothetical protein